MFCQGCPSKTNINTTGTTAGYIYVDSPEVYTRERLVNDRLEQEEWLRTQLAKTDEIEFRMQGLVDIRSFLGFSAAFGIKADALDAALKKAQIEQNMTGIKQQEEIDELNHRIKVLELLKKIKELNSESTNNIQDSEKNQQAMSNLENPNSQTKPEGGDTIGNSEKSSEDNESSVDNLYDELKNLLTEPKSIYETEAKPSPIDLFRDRLAYREELRAELIENSLDDRHDLEGNTLYRLKFDATVFPDFDTSAWAVIEITIVRGGHPEKQKLYSQWIDFMEIYINDEFIRRYYYPTTKEETELLLYTIDRLNEIDRPVEHDYMRNLDTIASAKKLSNRQLLEEYIANIMIENYKKWGLLNFFEIAQTENMRLSVIPKEVKSSFENSLANNSHAYCYAVTPKELVQRISDVASRREATQLSLSLGLLTGSVGIDSLLDYTKMTEGIFQAIRRQPLVVGYSKDSKGNSNNIFGWIIGPRFSLQKNGQGSYFRHTPLQQSLSALISLPSWWNEVNIEIKRYWKNEEGKIIKEFEAIEYSVSLPGDLLGVTDSIVSERKRPPVPKLLSEVHMDIGKEGDLVIAGTDLWRNPKVFIGSQQADKITVLPDMQGIVAHFNMVKQPGGWDLTNKSKDIDVFIWTSEGSQFAGTVTLHRQISKEE